METDVETQDGMKNIDLAKSEYDSAEETPSPTDKEVVSGLAEFADKDEYVDEL